MRNWRQLFVTYPATCALGVACAWGVASLNDGANLAALSPFAVAQDDPFGDDLDDADPFGTDADDEAVDETADDSDPFGGSFDDEEEDADDFDFDTEAEEE